MEHAVEGGIDILRALPEAKARAAAYFLEFLAAGDEEAIATLEVLGDAELLAAVNAAEKGPKNGCVEESVP